MPQFQIIVKKGDEIVTVHGPFASRYAAKRFKSEAGALDKYRDEAHTIELKAA